MKLSHWNLLIAMRLDISRLLDRTLSAENTRFSERNAAAPVDPGTLSRLHGELRNKLDALRDNLSREFTENETYLIMFPLVLLCDEMVMCRLAKEQQTSWSLLQSELFQINYGGDVFYDFVDERLEKPDTPPMVYEVLYFCLAAGFVGKFGESSGKVQRYRSLLAEQLLGASGVPGRKRRRRAARDAQDDREGRLRKRERDRKEEGLVAAPTPPPDGPPRRRIDWRGLMPYGVAVAALSMAALAVLFFTNL